MIKAPRARRLPWTATLVAAVLALTGCGGEPSGEISGTVTVDGQAPTGGASITFIPADGKSPGGGSMIENGRYSVKVAPGKYKVEVRVPRLGRGKGTKAEGPGPGGGGDIEEALPAKYNDQTELTFEVQAGSNEKNWELKTK